ncbi:Flp pilus assembly protein CpaB [Tabrizicola sp.]|uniref:Flp pilus assembly protein CpaB n=1 Tax=Tabrizicola sp. TaxID=2005166 RepID=UPI003D28D78C
MRRSQILLLALLSGVGTLALLQFTRSPEVVVQTVASSDRINVLVYSRDLPRGTLLDESSVRWQEQLISAAPADGVTSTASRPEVPPAFLDKLLRRDVLAGEAVSNSAIVDGIAGFMSMTLQPGRRAVGINVAAQQLAGGFILPEDRVDVIHTLREDTDGDGQDENVTRFILENLRVLAIGETPSTRTTARTADEQASQTINDSSNSLIGPTVTLEVSDEEAEVLFAALADGDISLALRALDDQGPSRIVPVETEETAAPAKPAAQTQTSAATSEPAPLRARVVEPETLRIRIIGSGSTRYEDVALTTPGADGE